MATKKTGEVDLISAVKAMRAQEMTQPTDPAELLKTLKKKSCSMETLMWADLCGSTEMKQLVAANPKADEAVIDALLLDSEAAPWYVIDLLQRPEVFAAFVADIYGDDNPFTDASSILDLCSETGTIHRENELRELIPKMGAAKVLQAELLRILWRFGRTQNYGVAYQLDLDDAMFLVLNEAVDQIAGINQRSKNILRALLRWSQVEQRGCYEPLPRVLLERYEPVNVVVDLYVLDCPEFVPFDSAKSY